MALVPSFVRSAFSASLISIFFGPGFPIVVRHSARILARWLLTGCIGWSGGLGRVGSVFIPFLVGTRACLRTNRRYRPCEHLCTRGLRFCSLLMLIGFQEGRDHGLYAMSLTTRSQYSKFSLTLTNIMASPLISRHMLVHGPARKKFAPTCTDKYLKAQRISLLSAKTLMSHSSLSDE